jgi:hypothetical protein
MNFLGITGMGGSEFMGWTMRGVTTIINSFLLLVIERL